MRIALVRLSSLGDIILCMASLQMIRRHLPDCHVTWITDRRFAAVLEHQPDIQQIVALDLKGLKKQPSWSALRGEYSRLHAGGDFDMVIDLHGMIKSAVVAAIAGGTRCGFSGPALKETLAGLLYQQSAAIPLELPAVSRYSSLVARCLGIPVQEATACDIAPFLGWSDQDRNMTDNYFDNRHQTTLIVPETSAPYKNYPPEQYARLASLLGGPVLVCHGNDRELAAARTIAGQADNVRVLPRLSINQLKAAIGRSDLVIGGDSGPSHMAWASGVPSITLFGATPVCIDPTERNLAIKSKSRVNLVKPDVNDTSLREIAVEEIAALGTRLLDTYRRRS
jgi:heptosyltransferase I